MTDEGRRPLLDHERPYLDRLAALLASTRRTAGLSQRRLAAAVGVSRQTVYRLESGRRRTRRSTLGRVAAVLAPRIGHDPKQLADLLARSAGPALAAENGYPPRRRHQQTRQALP